MPCLLQLATAERLAVLDPLEDVDVGPIAELVGDPAVQLVMHAPAGDLLLFATRYGVRATNVFDTQLAAGFVGHGISMAYDRLVERALNVTLAHNETFSDWSRRPLTEAQIAYAVGRRALPLRPGRRAASPGSTRWGGDRGPRTRSRAATVRPPRSSPIPSAPTSRSRVAGA